MSGGTIAAFVLCGGLLAGAFGALSEVYRRPAARRGRVRTPGRIARGRARYPGAGATRRAARAAARRARVRACHLPLSDAAEVSALNDFSLRVKPRERLAVVGPSGAGKTTIFQLAERFYDPQTGRVLLDGVDLRDADPADVRQRIAMVPQDTVMFAASARDNLRYGNWDASEEQMWQAARDANAEDFLRALPAGPRHVHGRRRRAPVRRPAPAHRHRPRAAARRALAAARRSDFRARRRKRAAGAGRARPADGRPHHDRHRPPPRHRARCRPHRGDGRWPHRRGRHARDAQRARGLYARLARLQFEDRAA